MTTSVPSLPIEPPEAPKQFTQPMFASLDVEVDSLVRIPQARNAFQVDGSGLTVAVLDTGLRTTHVDFVGRVRAQRNFTDDNGGVLSDASDGQGHGTHVAGIICARGVTVGVAPAAKVIPLKVLTNSGSGSFEAVRDALRWVADNAKEHGISAVSMSLGSSSNEDDDSAYEGDEIRKLVAELRERRIPTIVAAGNDYFKFKKEGMGYPAILRETISVGAVYDAAVGAMEYRSGAKANSTRADQLTPFSQRISRAKHPSTRTDVFAPGAPVTSSGIASDNAWSIQQGTSQATPVVAGVVLLLQQYYLRARNELPAVNDIIGCLRSGGTTIVDGDDEDDNVPHTKAKYQRVDALNALRSMQRRILRELYR